MPFKESEQMEAAQTLVLLNPAQLLAPVSCCVPVPTNDAMRCHKVQSWLSWPTSDYRIFTFWYSERQEHIQTWKKSPVDINCVQCTFLWTFVTKDLFLFSQNQRFPSPLPPCSFPSWPAWACITTSLSFVRGHDHEWWCCKSLSILRCVREAEQTGPFYYSFLPCDKGTAW